MIWCWFWNLILTRPDSLSLTLFLKIPVGGSFKRIEIFFWTFICLSSNSTIMLLCALSNKTKKLKLKPTNKRVSADAWKWNRTKRKNWPKNKQNPVFLARSETQAFANMNDSFHSTAGAIMVILKIYLTQKCLSRQPISENILVGTTGAFRTPLTYDNHPNPIPSRPTYCWGTFAIPTVFKKMILLEIA